MKEEIITESFDADSFGAALEVTPEESTEIVAAKPIVEKKYNYKDLDFSNPDTILYFGDDVTDQTTRILEAANNALGECETTSNARFEQVLSRLLGIDLELEAMIDKVDNPTAKEQKAIARKNAMAESTSNIPLLGDRISAWFTKKAEEKSTIDFKGTREQQQEDIEFLSNEIKNNGLAVTQRADAYQEYAKKLSPYVDQLQNVIEYGRFRMESYIEDVVKPLQAQLETTNDPNELTEIKGMLSVIQQRLTVLQEKLINHQTYMIRIGKMCNDWKLQAELSRRKTLLYRQIQDTLPLIKAQSTDTIALYESKDSLAVVQTFSDAINESMVRQSDIVTGMINDINAISANGIIHTETLDKMADGFVEHVELYRRGIEEANAAATIRQEELDKIRQRMAAGTQLFDATLNAVALVDDDNSVSLPSGIPSGIGARSFAPPKGNKTMGTTP